MTTRPRGRDNGSTGGLPDEVARRLIAFIERTTDFVAVTDDQANVVYLNEAARGLVGSTTVEAGGATTADFFSEEAFQIYFERIRPALLRGEAWQGVLPLQIGDGDPVEMWMSVVGGTRPGGEVTWLVTSSRDVSEWLRGRDELWRQATHDDLTDVASRALLMDRLDLALARTARGGLSVVVAYVDVDRMKQVNDRFGHDSGDQALIEVARRLRGAVRPSDTVARVGGDEFVVVLDGVAGVADADSMAQRIEGSVDGMSIEVEGRSVAFSASVGTAVGRGAIGAQELLVRADRAMYSNKAAHRNRRDRGDGTATSPVAITARDVAVALTQRSVVPHYQLVVETATGSAVGYQVLARLHPASGGTSAASEFVDSVEETALSLPFDLAILRAAADEVGDLASTGPAPRLYVHLGRGLVLSPEAPTLISGVIERSGLDAGQLFLEIPVRLFNRDARMTVEALQRVARLGPHLVVNAVATPPATLLNAALNTGLFGGLRFHIGRTDDPDESGHARAMIDLARRHDVPAFAVGIETTTQLDQLVALGVELAEGLLWGPPQALPGTPTHN